MLGFLISCGCNYIVEEGADETRVYLSKLNQNILGLKQTHSRKEYEIKYSGEKYAVTPAKGNNDTSMLSSRSSKDSDQSDSKLQDIREQSLNITTRKGERTPDKFEQEGIESKASNSATLYQKYSSSVVVIPNEIIKKARVNLEGSFLKIESSSSERKTQQKKTPINATDKLEQLNSLGILPNFEYAILDVREVDTTFGTERLVKVRNPWM